MPLSQPLPFFSFLALFFLTIPRTGLENGAVWLIGLYLLKCLKMKRRERRLENKVRQAVH